MEESEAIFKKRLKELAKYKGVGTQLISLYIPPGTDRGSVMDQLNQEISQSSNIKSPQTRKNVQAALHKIVAFLKRINFRLPKNGLVVFCGNISSIPGKSDVRLFALEPIKELKVKLYWCDSKFHLDPLLEMIKPTEFYGLITIDKKEATIALLKGKQYEILGKYTSGVSGKIRAGGQSAQRFARLREEAEHEFYKRVSEHANKAFLQHLNKLKGIIVGGPGATKNEFLNENLLDHRLRKIIIGTVDTAYTDESGIRELIFKSTELLRDTALMHEKRLLQKFFEEVAKDGLAVYGRKDVEKALEQGKIATLIISEELNLRVLKLICENCNFEKEIIIEEGKEIDIRSIECEKCKQKKFEIIEDLSYVEYLSEKAKLFGTKVELVSAETDEGKQFLEGFGGIGGLLRYK